MGNVLQIIKNKNNTTTSYTDEQNISLSEKIHEEVDKIASHYILTQDASEMLKLKDSSYYDNLIILTRDVILKYLDDSEIEFINEAKKGSKKEKALILNKKEGSSLFTSLDDISKMSSVKRKKMANNIAKFYINTHFRNGFSKIT